MDLRAIKENEKLLSYQTYQIFTFQVPGKKYTYFKCNDLNVFFVRYLRQFS